MDILDILIAKKKSFTGETERLTRQANEAMEKANEVAAKIEEAEAVLSAAQEAQSAAEAANAQVQEIAENLDGITEDLTAAAGEVVDEKVAQATASLTSDINNLTTNLANKVSDITTEDNNTSAVKVKNIKVQKANSNNSYPIVKNYTSTGNNEDGSMTQKAITDKFTELNTKIDNYTPTNISGSTNLGAANAGKMVKIDTDGEIIPSTITESQLIESLVESNTYTSEDIVGLEIDYANKSFKRTQAAFNLAAGENFDKFKMFGGRKRCIVNAEGRIIAWYGDNNYVEDGSAGQVMIYQPKFYYKRVINISDTIPEGKVVRKENLMISENPQIGFKLHPLFINEEGEEIDYVLLPAYESTYFDVSANDIVTDDSGTIDVENDYLLSIAGTKPLSGANKTFNIEVAEQMANNIGEGWHITNMAAESANQMLEMIELGTLNGQIAIEAGIVNIPSNVGINGASITGSTSALGNTTGAAESTVNELQGTTTTYTEPGYRAISYRGFENPWGNMWRFIGGTYAFGDGTLGSGVPYIKADYSDIYKNIKFQLPTNSSWISGMGIGETDLDWVYLPIEASYASSLLPVGDFTWIKTLLNGYDSILIGGTNRQGDNCGLFYYASDQALGNSSASCGARIMFIPKKNAIYTANIAAWNSIMGA